MIPDTEWWEQCVREPLAAVPDIDAPSGTRRYWRYAVAAVAFRPYSAGYESARAWWDGFLRDGFAALPGVEQVYDTVWEYAPDGAQTGYARRTRYTIGHKYVNTLVGGSPSKRLVDRQTRYRVSTRLCPTV